MDLKHHGALDGTTGSAHELRYDPEDTGLDTAHSLLIDCGLFQGSDSNPQGMANANNLDIDFDISAIRALVITHVHVDHCARIPWLLAAGFNGPILCSEPSAALLPIVLEDAFRISFTRQPKVVERYLKHIATRIISVPYNTWHTVTTGINDNSPFARIRFQRAGHILGSAYVEIEPDQQGKSAQRSGTAHRTVFSGDLGAPHAPILPEPNAPQRADTLVIESTYGNRVHHNREHRREQLAKVIAHALTDKGTALIPAFSIGRTQELLYELEDLLHEKQGQPINDHLNWCDLPVILDSPLASRFTQVYQQLTPFWEQEALDRLAANRQPLGFKQLITVDDHAAHQRMVAHLSSSARPAVVISGSGMCNAGRIVNYLKAMLGDSRHHVLFVGYQAKGTPGAAIQQYGPRGGYVDMDNRRITIRAGVDSISGYSAHADQNDLLRFVTSMQTWPRHIRIVHGDNNAKQGLKESLKEAYKREGQDTPDIVIP